MENVERRLFDWIALSLVDGLGSVSYRNLIRKFHSPDQVFKASPKDLESAGGIRRKVVEQIKGFRKAAEVEHELELIEQHRVTLVTFVDDNYPAHLLHIYDPPPFLYLKGELRKEDSLAVAVVGSRFASHYGKSSAESISNDLAQEGLTVVSGMARGIDACAHRGALAAGGRTIAVLGCGIAVNYPMENRKLKEAIAAQGAVLSEFPMSASPAASHFPMRNRIISGLSLGVVVVEASHRSGSLITARLALEQGREVFAVPGSIDSLRSRGTHKLIKDGAKLVEDAHDIITELLPQIKTRPRSAASSQENETSLNEEARCILDALGQNQLQIDRIITETGLQSSRIASILLDLELKGMVRQLPGKVFAKK
jgi:DNA processing protein